MDKTNKQKPELPNNPSLVSVSGSAEREAAVGDFLQNNCLTFAEVEGFIITWTPQTPESYAQRTPREKRLYQLWVIMKQKIEKETGRSF